jgi:putative addiction module component (TIGR02574 family)
MTWWSTIYNACMSALLDEMEKQSRLLTPQEKARLAHILIEDLDASIDSEVEQVWITESQRRYQAYRKGEVAAHPGDEVMTRARNRIK